MPIKATYNQIYSQSGVKAGASGTDWKLVAFNEETSLRDSMANVFGQVHFNQHNLLTLILFQ